MAQYIDKDALLAEIDSLVDKGRYHEEYDCAYRDGNNGALHALKSKLGNLEVKEVDLEKEIDQSFVNLDYHLDAYNRVEDYVGENIDMVEYKRIAKYFFELGLKLQKGE